MSRLMCEPTRITELCQCASVRSKTMWTGKAFQRTIVNFLNIGTPQKIVVITLKVEQDDVSLELFIQKMQRELQTV